MQRTCKSNFNAKLALLFKHSRGAKRKKKWNRNQLNVLNIHLEKKRKTFLRNRFKEFFGLEPDNEVLKILKYIRQENVFGFGMA